MTDVVIAGIGLTRWGALGGILAFAGSESDAGCH